MIAGAELKTIAVSIYTGTMESQTFQKCQLIEIVCWNEVFVGWDEKVIHWN